MCRAHSVVVFMMINFATCTTAHGLLESFLDYRKFKEMVPG